MHSDNFMYKLCNIKSSTANMTIYHQIDGDMVDVYTHRMVEELKEILAQFMDSKIDICAHFKCTKDAICSKIVKIEIAFSMTLCAERKGKIAYAEINSYMFAASDVTTMHNILSHSM